MIKFRHYRNSDAFGNKYVVGLNIYRNISERFTIDLIIGKHVFVMMIGS